MKKHAIRNDDESIWICFSGEVPSVGDEVSFFESQIPNADERTFVVKKVLWFFDDTCGSQARVYIDEIEKVSDE